MTLSENYDFNLSMVKWVIIFGNVGSSHGLWVTFFLQCFSYAECRVIGVLHCEDIRAFSCKDLGFFLSVHSSGFAIEIMGGKRKWVEPPSYTRWKKNLEVWYILRRGIFTGYME